MPKFSPTPSQLYTTFAAGNVICAVPLESVYGSAAFWERMTARGAMAATIVCASYGSWVALLRNCEMLDVVHHPAPDF